MSTDTLEDIDTLEVVDLEEIMKDKIPCAYKEWDGCENEAKWRCTLTCGHQHNVCVKHRGIILAILARKKEWICGPSGIKVTGAEWVEL